MIVTDGGLSDFSETVEVLVSLSRQPLSVVVVGVGGGDMSKLVRLDSDTQRLQHNNLEADRDILQFVREFIAKLDIL